MNRILIATALAVGLLAARPFLVAAQMLDTTPPVLTAFDFAPRTIDTSGGDATVTVTFSATDDLSGMHFFDMRFRSPSGAETIAQGNCHGLACTGSATAPFAQYATEGGTWTVPWLVLCDLVGNCQSFTTNDLTTMGFPTQLTVIAGELDTTPPELTAFDFAPRTIDTSGGDATVTVTFSATDDLSGMHFFDMRFRSQSGAETIAQGNCHGLACTGSATAPFAQYATEGGVWTVPWLALCDLVGNCQSFTTNDLTTMGFPTRLLNTSQAVSELLPANGGGTVDGKSGKRKTVGLWARVENIGSQAASNVQVGFEVSADGGQTFTKIGGAVRIGTIAAAAAANVTTKLQVLPGQYTVRVVVDPANRIAEYAEDNNALSFLLIVP